MNESVNRTTNNIFKLPSKRKGQNQLTCDIYTFANKKYRLQVSVETELEAYTTSVSHARKCDVSGIRCVVIYKEPSEDITQDTKPLKVYLLPKDIVREEVEK